MRIFLTGGTGFIGSHLVRALLKRGDECVVVSRSGRDPWQHPRVRVIVGDPTTTGDWQREVATAEAVVSLAGQRIVEPPLRWTERRKRLLRDSRINTTRNVVAAIRDSSPRPATLISASAVGYYGSCGDKTLDESAPPGADFLGKLAREWEAAATEARVVARVTVVRSGLILSTDSPVLQPLLPLFKLGLGGPWGDGRQWWSWIHLADVIGLMLFVLDNVLEGPVNLTAPNPVTVNDFAKALGRAVRRPALFRVPAAVLRVALGEAADALLGSQRVLPKRALDRGYQFQFPDLTGALQHLV